MNTERRLAIGLEGMATLSRRYQGLIAASWRRILLLRVIHPVARCNPRPKRLSTHSRSAAAGVTERPGHPPSNCGEQKLGLGTFFILPVHPFDRSRPQQPRKFKHCLDRTV
ncbi:uncharacterized protein BO88DRAFT_405422 [Aspergillus vadensis CBS 113365]|uniref:Uncharacterized protein n=1 Tax=Aspergillus vadensis (strain CBS 113365 / IMI 142717 / IBT 24658) TaxID=1448311 RepID=A0A319BRV4_ASPVC|nr:hypothetical protein BO88DRAFT_405422 [Aspergillus vadensis CBS 113365]PYH68563.1 hypothetical protein BO88DRAFT_405422 [Aspergillus vadensis CBS 113365]